MKNKYNFIKKSLLTLIMFTSAFSLSVQAQELVKDINVGSQSSYPDHFVEVNGTAYFSALTPQNGYELWKSDGTEAGTVMVKDIVPGTASSGPKFLTNVNGVLFFNATTTNGGNELWKSDGTAAGTVVVKYINPSQGVYGGSDPYDLTAVNGILFFTAKNGVQNNGRELYKSDGTEAGTVMVKDIYLGGSDSDPDDLININGTLFFSADNGSGRNLWKSDGTEAGTVLVKQICNNTNRPWTCCPFFRNVNGVLFFVPINNSSNTSGSELWKSDGTEAGTVLVKNIRIGEGGSDKYMEVANGLLYFRAKDDVNGEELWKSDGTASGTVIVKDINPGFASSYPGKLTEYSGSIYFVADNGTSGYELWRSDGSNSGTNMVIDIYPGAGSASPGLFLPFNNDLYFRALNSNNSITTWKTDGTAGGTTEHSNSNLEYGLWNVAGQEISPACVIVNDVLFYGMSSSGTGKELWKFKPSTAAIPEAEMISSQLLIYPNPSNGIFQLTFENMQITNAKLEIYNVLGVKVYTASNVQQQMQIDLSSASKGLYFVRVYSEGKMVNQKIIIR